MLGFFLKKSSKHSLPLTHEIYSYETILYSLVGLARYMYMLQGFVQYQGSRVKAIRS